MNDITQREQCPKKHSPRAPQVRTEAEKWAREELNLRPHAYQATRAALELRHQIGLSRGRSDVRRHSPRSDAGVFPAI